MVGPRLTTKIAPRRLLHRWVAGYQDTGVKVKTTATPSEGCAGVTQSAKHSLQGGQERGRCSPGHSRTFLRKCCRGPASTAGREDFSRNPAHCLRVCRSIQAYTEPNVLARKTGRLKRSCVASATRCRHLVSKSTAKWAVKSFPSLRRPGRNYPVQPEL